MYKKFLKFSLVIMVLALPMLAAVNFASAQVDLGLEAGEQIGLANTSPKVVIINVVRVLLGFLALIAVILIMYAGFIWMTAEGNAEKIEKAKKILRNAAIGLVIILSAFGIVSFILSKLGGNCDGPNCANNCDPACSSGQVCCTWGCDDSCDTPPPPPPPDAFRISGTEPYNQEQNVYRNVVIRAFFNDEIDHGVDASKKFEVEKTGDVAANGRIIAETYPPQVIAMEALAADSILGDATTSLSWREINFRAKATCKDKFGNDTPNCLPEKSRIRVTVNGNGGGIVAIDGRALTCAGEHPCVFTFTTGNEVDIEAPSSGIIPAQICKDDGTLASDANIVGGWGKDDIRITKLEFYQRKVNAAGEPLEDETLSQPPHPGDHSNYLYAEHKYATAGMNINDYYNFTAYTEDLAGHAATSTFQTNIKPGHCCNGLKDADEEDVDCGGADCLACEGGACNRVEPNQCGEGSANCADELCASGFCQCTTDDCICKKRPIITSVSPVGGFCKGAPNKYCRTNADCEKVTGDKTCDTATPNGAPLNLVTIQGKNFGTVGNLMENVLTNVNFEQGNIGGVPADWKKAAQGHASVGIVSEAGNFVSPYKSVKIHVDANEAYPDICSEDLCKHQGKYSKFPFACEWRNEGGANKCVFAHHANCGPGECKKNEGASLTWPYTNRVMWSELSYDISKLNFKVGDRYVLRFKYKGKAGNSLNIMSAYALGSTSQSWRRVTSAYSDPECVLEEYGGAYCKDEPGKCKCIDDPNSCCMHAPYQTKPYSAHDYSPIPAGEYNEWKTYEAYFTYTAEMDSWRDRSNNIKRSVGITTPNKNSGTGTDLYIDDFMFARLPSTGGVTFLGAKGNQADDRLGFFPTDLNPQCISNWTDRQIIIVVPEGVTTGSIEVKGESGITDTTDDPYGPAIRDFSANTIVRPGICRVVNTKCEGVPGCLEDHGLQNDTLSYYGLNLVTGAEGYFGNWWGANFKGFDSVFGANNNLEGTAKVPNLASGQTTAFVVKNVNSNNLNFIKDEEPYSGPRIVSFEPVTGKSGQYVTIRGQKFGSGRGQSQVFFGNTGGKEAGYDFPAVCAESVWSDNQVIIKVPEGIADGNYILTMKLGAETIDTSGLARSQFVVDSSKELAPSLCRLEPSIGPVGSDVSFWGEYFGVENSGSKIKFNLNKIQTGANIIYWGTDDQETQGLKPDKVRTSVPVKSITGPVRLIKNGNLEGNGLNFKVGMCASNAECGEEAVCCPADSPSKGRCIGFVKDDRGNVVESTAAGLCYNEFTSCVNEWDFSTKGGEEGDPCNANESPDCSYGACDAGLICDSSTINVSNPCGTCRKQCGDYPSCNSNGCDTGEKCATRLQDDETKKCLCVKEPTSCEGYDLVQCADSLYCPNSPGNCSAKAEGTPTETGTCDFSCASKAGCTDSNGANLCHYDNNINKCVIDSACSKEVTVNSNILTATCILHELSGRYKIDYAPSCPAGWTRITGNRCIENGTTCDICANGFNCERGTVTGVDGVRMGICANNASVCPSGSACTSENKCIKNDPGSCLCCCDINSNYKPGDSEYPGNAACCAPLTCGDECGSGGTNNTEEIEGMVDTNPYNEPGDVDYGRCTGCALGGGDQSDWDRACNCEGTTGKFCDATDNPAGVCRDCTELSVATECSKHDATCCVDGKYDNACKGVGGDKDILEGDDPNLAYCAYYDCGGFDIEFKCASSTPTIDGDHDSQDCNGKCSPPPDMSCYSDASRACTKNCGEIYRCFGSNGCYDYNLPAPAPYTYDLRCKQFSSSESNEDDDVVTKGCACCCDPAKTGTDKFLENGEKSPDYDTCQDLDNKKLKCVADKGDKCTGNDRGLCCGCDADLDCVPQPEISPDDQDPELNIPNDVGCGYEKCCYPRPFIEETVPADDANNICLNPQISALFSTQMDVSSFQGNIILAYATTTCANGNVELAFVDQAEKGFWQKMVIKVKSFFGKLFRKNSDNAFARDSGDLKYCAVIGTTGFEQVSNNNEPVKTKAIFRIKELLEPDTEYFVIVKGDSNLMDQASEGVLSHWKVGMNDRGGDDEVFDNIRYVNSRVWSFHTGIKVCPIEKVSIFPHDYLFKTNINDLGEDDSVKINNSTWDTAYDSDKEYAAKALSEDYQILVPVKGYSWVWDWSILNTSIVATTTRAFNQIDINSEYQLIAAQENITYGTTIATTTVRLTDKTMESAGDGKEAATDITVFICDNPWPDIKPNRSWEPVKDWLRCEGNADKVNYGSCSTEDPADQTRGKPCEGWDNNNNPVPGTCVDNCTITDAGCVYTNQEIFYCRDKGVKNILDDDLPKIYGDAIRGSSTVQDVFKEFYYLRH